MSGILTPFISENRLESLFLNNFLHNISNCNIYINLSIPAIAAMHGPHSVSEFGHCTVIHCDTGGVSLDDQ